MSTDADELDLERARRETYNAFFAANQPHASAIYNEPGMDPRHILEQISTFPADGSKSIEDHVREWHDAQPHPRNPALTVAEYPVAVKLATRTKFGGHATPEEAGAFWHEFQSANQRLAQKGQEPMSPNDYLRVLDELAPVSAALHGRPPTMHEVANLKDASPAERRKHYEDMPDSLYPAVSAGQMARYMTMANFHAMPQVRRPAQKSEAAYFAASSASPKDIADYYSAMMPVQHQAQPKPAAPLPGTEQAQT